MKTKNRRNTVIGAIVGVVIIAAVAAYLLRPSDDGVMVLQPYYPDKFVTVENLSGDYEFFESISLGGAWCGTEPALLLRFEPKDNRLFTIGVTQYIENSTVGGISIYDDQYAGTLSTWSENDIGWKGNSAVFGKALLPIGCHDNRLYIEARTLDERDDYVNCVVALPAPRDSGRQLVRLKFRERFTVGEDENGHPLYTSGEELYSVSFEFDIPEPNGEPYEVIHAVDASERGDGETIIYTLVRQNAEFGGDRELAYVDDGGIVLEQLEDGEWTAVQGASFLTMTTEGNGHTMPLYFSTEYPEQLDSSATYRITLPLSEFPDGQGKTYDLQFSFKFPE